MKLKETTGYEHMIAVIAGGVEWEASLLADDLRGYLHFGETRVSTGFQPIINCLPHLQDSLKPENIVVIEDRYYGVRQQVTTLGLVVVIEDQSREERQQQAIDLQNLVRQRNIPLLIIRKGWQEIQSFHPENYFIAPTHVMNRDELLKAVSELVPTHPSEPNFQSRHPQRTAAL